MTTEEDKADRGFTRRGYGLLCLAMALAFPAHLLLYAAPYGLGVHYDSAVYLNSALNLLDGKGYAVDLTGGAPRPAVWFPPGYPVLMAASLRFISDPALALELLSAVCMGLGVWVMSRLAKHYCGGNLAGAAACTALYAFSVVNLEVHSWAQSEPPFVLFTLAALYFLARHLDEGRWGHLAAGGLFCALAALTRYAGVALIGAATVWLLLARGPAAANRIWRAGAFMATAASPLAAFIVRNRLAGCGYTGRPMTVFLIDGEKLTQLAASVSGAVVPGSDRFRVFPGQEFAVFAAALAALALTVFLFQRSRRNPGEDSPPASLGLFLFYPLAYMLMLATLITFVDSTIVFDMRLLSIAIIPVFVFAGGVLCRARFSSRSARRAFTALVCAQMVLFAASYGAWTWYMAKNGRGQSARKCLSPQADAFAASVTGGADLYSNNVEGLYFRLREPVGTYKDLCRASALEGRPRYIVHLETSDRLTLNSVAWSGDRALPGCVKRALVMKDGPVSVYRVE
ncbi:MAG: ArnT family glycosyltransferase [Thermodesulfobacteriota bacterium]